MKIIEYRPVQLGTGVSLADAEARVKEIAEKKTSTYHKAFKQGRIEIHHYPRRSYGQYDVRERVREEDSLAIAMNVCGNCSDKFENFTNEEHYLCLKCRS